MPQSTKLDSPSAADLERQFLDDIELGAIENGIEVPPTGPDTHYGMTATGAANLVSIIISDIQLCDNDIDPLNAVGDALEEIRIKDGLPELSPTAATGTLTAIAYGIVTVPIGLQFTGPGGVVGYITDEVSNPSSTQTTLPLNYTFTNKGATGLAQGTQIRFLNGPMNLASTGNIVTINDGTDVESDDHKRDRIMNRRMYPPQGGNWSQLRETGLSSSSVDDCYVFPTIGGPTTARVVLLQNGTQANGYARSVPEAVVIEQRSLFVDAYPKDSDLIDVKSTGETLIDVVVSITIPQSSSSKWTDLSPWPELPLLVSAVATNRITLDDISGYTGSHSAPVLNAHLVLWSVANRAAYRCHVSNVVNSTQFDVAWDDALPTGTVPPQIGDWFFADSPNMKSYITTFLNAMATLGCGENTTTAARLRRSFRHPIPGATAGNVVIGQPYTLSSTQLTAVQSAYPEISNINYAYLPVSVPAIPGSVMTPPNTLRIRNIAFAKGS